MVRIPNNYFRVSTTDRAPLTIGLLLNSHVEIPAYAAAIIEDIKASNFARIELLIARKHAAPAQSNPLLYNLYLRLDARMKPANDPLQKINCVDLLSEIETIDVESAGAETENPLPADVAEKIRAKNLDVLIRLGGDDLGVDTLQLARYGVWSYHHGDDEFYRGGPAQFWELREHSPLSGAVLQVRTENRERVVLCKSWFATEQTISVSRNRYTPYWGSSDLMIQKLNQLHRFGWDSLLEEAVPSAPYKGKRASYTTPTNWDMLFWLGPILIKKAIAYPFRKPTVQHWRVAARVNARPLHDCEVGSELSRSDLSGFRWIDPPQGHAWADPFIFEHDGKYWAFFEDYSYQEKRAAIACAEISPQGEFGPPTLCLGHPERHYSYPHVFRSGDDIFMVPESFDSNSVDLYRCRQFPNQWVHEATLFQGKFVDTTIWQYEGLWWLATTSADPGPGAGCLLLFYSQSLTGDWHFHPGNPISTDIRQNRGAGKVFRSGHRLIRPSQSCAPTYGYSFGFNEITELSKTRYTERPLRSITPEHWPALTGVHTYNWAGNIELIDGSSNEPLRRVQGAPV
jgi:hypothetical protein